jgi:hypothetical protein
MGMASNRSHSLSRRAALRGVLAGAAVAVGLPWLERFAPPASAQGTAPRRFGLFFWGNGVLPQRWVPSGTGPGFGLSPQLSRLEPFRDKLTVVSGARVVVPNATTHLPGPGGLLTGRPLVQLRESDWRIDGPTIDQLVAHAVGGATRFPSLEISVAPGTHGLSQVGTQQWMGAENSPTALFERLFGDGFAPPGTSPLADRVRALRSSVLDAVADDFGALRRRVGSDDVRRLDRHLDAVRELEVRIARVEPPRAACAPPARPVVPVWEGPRAPIRDLCDIMARMTAAALSCDLTRVFSFWHSDPLSDHLYDDFVDGHHALTHAEPGQQPMVDAIVHDIMGDFGSLLARLDEIDEGEGSLLDHCGILATTDCAHGRLHSLDEYPLLVAGSMGGSLLTGTHIRYVDGPNAARLPLTLARAAGASLDVFGGGVGAVRDPFDEVLRR